MLNAGGLIAAYIGGFDNVATKHPMLSIPLFEKYPYLFPNLLAAAFPLLSAIISWLWLEETLPSKSGKIKLSESQDDQSEGSEETVHDSLEPAPYGEIFTRRVNIVMFSFGVLSLMGSAIQAIHPLFFFTKTVYGGLGFPTQQISTAIMIRSVAVLGIQFVAFPWLQRQFGTWRLYKVLMFFWIPTFLLLPICNLLAREGSVVWTWIVLTISLLCAAIANMAFVCNLMIVNEAAPTERSLGAINGEFGFGRFDLLPLPRAK